MSFLHRRVLDIGPVVVLKKQAQNEIGGNTIKKLYLIYISKNGVNCTRVVYVKRECSSNGRALASHARGKGIDAPLFQNFNFFYLRMMYPH